METESMIFFQGRIIRVWLLARYELSVKEAPEK